jgi:hypothetical protein
MGYRVLSYEEAKELVAKGGYRYLVGRSEFEAFTNYYCRQIDNNELECVKTWWNGRIYQGGGAVFRGTAEEVYAWIAWDAKETIAPVRVKAALRSTFDVEVDREKVNEARRSVLRKVLGVVG